MLRRRSDNRLESTLMQTREILQPIVTAQGWNTQDRMSNSSRDERHCIESSIL